MKKIKKILKSVKSILYHYPEIYKMLLKEFKKIPVYKKIGVLLIIGIFSIGGLFYFPARSGKRLWRRIRKLPAYQITGIIVILILFVIGVKYLWPKIYKPQPKQIYEAAVMVRSQNNSDPAEDMRSSLKAGDVLVIQTDGHKWSRSERVSYLILRMELTEEQKNKLIRGEEREIKFKDLPAEEQKRLKEDEREDEPRRETIRARQYHIDMSEFEGFKPSDLIGGQPYQDEVYDWSIVKKKPKIK